MVQARYGGGGRIPYPAKRYFILGYFILSHGPVVLCCFYFFFYPSYLLVCNCAAMALFFFFDAVSLSGNLAFFMLYALLEGIIVARQTYSGVFICLSLQSAYIFPVTGTLGLWVLHL